MADCCQMTGDLHDRQRRVLQIVLGVNAAMFAVELVAGLTAHSTSLIADSMDMLGDAIVYGVSLSVLARGAVWQARTTLLKGTVTAADRSRIARRGEEVLAGMRGVATSKRRSQ